MPPDKELFWNSFGAWLADHGVELEGEPTRSGKWKAYVDINKLKWAIIELGVTEDD